jgi:hypothetical protein
MDPELVSLVEQKVFAAISMTHASKKVRLPVVSFANNPIVQRVCYVQPAGYRSRFFATFSVT